MRSESALIDEIEKDFTYLKEKVGSEYLSSLTKDWDSKCISQPLRFVNKDLTINRTALKNFRKNLIFVSDIPSFRPSWVNPINILGGGRRGAIRNLKEILDILVLIGYGSLLKKYPCSPVGKPNIFHCRGYDFTYRWAKHIYGLGLFKKTVEGRIRADFTALDIGSSYGIFSYMLKKEFSNSHQALLDFPEQLLLAHYFLGMAFPDARIAGFRAVDTAKNIDRQFLSQYDFILIPVTHYKKVVPSSLDLISNFASLGEMTRRWFDHYLKGEPFASTRYFYTHNRFQSAPEFEGGMTVLDYPFGEFRNCHFAINPMFGFYYPRKSFFFYEKRHISSQFFEFIGERA